MSTLEKFLRSNLLTNDTTKQLPKVHKHIMLLGRCKGDLQDRERAAKELNMSLACLEEFYRDSVDLAVQELILDPDHVKSKIRAATAEEDGRESDINH